MNLAQLQAERKIWAERNFPHATAEDHLIGVMEELGELSHANLKGRMKVRAGVNDGVLVAKERDAIGDIVIYLTGYCTDRGFSIAECVERAWDEVKDRDWVANPVDGNINRSDIEPKGRGWPRGGVVVYPYKDGPVTVLGPETFTDGQVICWQGRNYTLQGN